MIGVMRWQQARDKDGNVQINGMQSGEYRVSKCVIDYGALCTVYRLWYKNELLKDCNDFDECKQAAEKHNAKSEPTARLFAQVRWNDEFGPRRPRKETK
jgi:hypothetical protein